MFSDFFWSCVLTNSVGAFIFRFKSTVMSENKGNAAVIVAVIGMFGVVATGLFSNWDKIFPPEKKIEKLADENSNSNSEEVEVQDLVVEKAEEIILESPDVPLIQDFKYKVITHTASHETMVNADSDENIFIILEGDKSYYRTLLDNVGINDFEYGANDEFEFVIHKDLGELKSFKLEIRENGSNPDYIDGWYPEKIEILDFNHGGSYEASIYRWLDDGEGERQDYSNKL